METPSHRTRLSSAYVWTLRITVGSAGIMTLLSLIFCFVRGMSNGMFFLLAVNVLITALLAAWNIWSYNRGYMDVGKHWFLLVVCAALIWQCIVTDTYVFNLPSSSSNEGSSNSSSLNYTTYETGFTTLVSSFSSTPSSPLLPSTLLSTIKTTLKG